MSDKSGNEIHLEALVSKLHSEGVNKGQAEAEKILEAARAEAADIVRKARAEADAMTKAAEAKTAEFQENAVASVRLAARDTILALNQSVCDLFEKAFRKEISTVLDDPEFLRTMILTLASDWAEGKPVTASVRPEVGQKLLALSKSGVEGMLQEGIEIRINRSVSNGFRIRIKGEEVAFDFSDESIVESLKVHLSPQLNDLLEL